MNKNTSKYPIFSDETLYTNQINWIEKQINNCKDDSFNNIEAAKDKLEELFFIRLICKQADKLTDANLRLAENKLHGFRNSFLSLNGFDKLNTTLKVAKKRAADKENGSKKLDVTISNSAFEKLNLIIEKTNKTKTAIIEDLLKDYNII